MKCIISILCSDVMLLADIYTINILSFSNNYFMYFFLLNFFLFAVTASVSSKSSNGGDKEKMQLDINRSKQSIMEKQVSVTISTNIIYLKFSKQFSRIFCIVSGKKKLNCRRKNINQAIFIFRLH